MSEPTDASANMSVRAQGMRGGQFGDNNIQHNLSFHLEPEYSSQVPHQLPLRLPHFAGRANELTILNTLLTEPSGQTGTVIISAIEGTAGIGKTSLAVFWSHLVADQFPDGQLYVNLRGFDPSGVSVDPAEVVRGFLDALGVIPERIPVDLNAQAALYRSLLSGRRMLVVLDNARDSDQVRPLLPGSSGCLVLITSRRQLLGLIAGEGARPLVLPLPTLEEAWELLSSRLGIERVNAEPEAAKEIIVRCAKLPLALAIVAAHVATRRHVPLAAVAAELRDAGALDTLDAGPAYESVRTAISWSYERLGATAALLFRMLGLHPGESISTTAAASLADIPVRATHKAFEELVDAYLVTEVAPQRYTFHDLLRSYARELTQHRDSSADRERATERILDHYLHTSATANDLLDPHGKKIDITPATAGVVNFPLQTSGDALLWLAAEHATILTAIAHAAAEERDAHVWQLARTLSIFFKRRGHIHDLLHTQQVALEAAMRQSNEAWLAFSHQNLGVAYMRLTAYDDAQSQYSQAIGLYRRMGDRALEAETHRTFGQAYEWQGKYQDALHEAEQAFTLFQSVNHKIGEAASLNAIGWYRALQGQYSDALTACTEALRLQKATGDRYRSAATWDSLGYIHHNCGDHAEALICYRGAYAIYRESGDRWLESEVLMHLGDTQRALGDVSEAASTWQQAFDLMDEIGHPDAYKVRCRLDRLGEAR